MIINHSQLDLTGSHQRSESTQRQETLQLFRVSSDGMVRQSVNVERDEVSLSKRALELAARVEQNDPEIDRDVQRAYEEQLAAQKAKEDPTETEDEPALTQGLIPISKTTSVQESLGLDSRMLLIKQILEFVSGKDISFFDPVNLQFSAANSVVVTGSSEAPELDEPAEASTSAPGQLGLSYRYAETYREEEHTSFTAQGQVSTSDGRTLSIDLEVNMSRSFVQHSQLQIDAGARLKDPLVINFDGPATELTEKKYSFDIDADGVDDQISFVKSHSGFLALDRNEDGLINDGSELFGALSGQGFAELAEFDQDGNGFIDEGDEIYDRLRIWVKQDDGTDQLLALGDKNIGAIYLGSAETSFELKDSNNQLQGVVRSTGVFLTEDGGQGSVQQIDLAV